LHNVGAFVRNAVSSVIDERVDRDEWALADICRVISASASGNAHRVYGLDPAS
jgi:hypothetical protein